MCSRFRTISPTKTSNENEKNIIIESRDKIQKSLSIRKTLLSAHARHENKNFVNSNKEVGTALPTKTWNVRDNSLNYSQNLFIIIFLLDIPGPTTGAYERRSEKNDKAFEEFPKTENKQYWL